MSEGATFDEPFEIDAVLRLLHLAVAPITVYVSVVDVDVGDLRPSSISSSRDS